MTENMFHKWGREDAEIGEDCIPELYAAMRRDIAEYVAGYREIKPDTATGYKWLDAVPVAVKAEVAAGLYFPTDEEYAEDWQKHSIGEWSK